MIYLVARTDSVGYEEYGSFIVSAKSRKEASDLCKDYYGFDLKDKPVKITLIKSVGKSEKILRSFNAG